MLPIASLLVLLTMSILVTRVATVALTLTGMSRQSAKFQARSAFTGVGYTTTEAENIANHPVRRRIVMMLMLLGNIGLVTVVSTLMLSFLGQGEVGGRWIRFTILMGGLVLLWSIAISGWVDRQLSRLIERALRRWTDLDTRDYARLLRLSGDYGVTEVMVQADDWMANKTLAEMRLQDEGIQVLGILREDGQYLGAPRGATAIEYGDTLILYGRTGQVAALDRRGEWGGDALHVQAVQEAQDDQDAGTEPEPQATPAAVADRG
ncbi:MAG: TrkA C-terminal domain-containing protein [Planctomycetota bacterium]|jgi:hypothetical protein